MYTVELKPRASAHLKKAAFFYEAQQLGLGVRFVDEVQNAIATLAINPFYAKRYKDVRGYNLKNFPFLILFRVDEIKWMVSIIAIFHTSQNPQKYTQSSNRSEQ